MIVVTFDVLAHQGDELGARQPIPEARRLWGMMFSQYQGRICVLATGVDKNKTPILMEWLKRENYKAGMLDLTDETNTDAKLERVRAIQAGVGRIDWFIDSDPSTVSRVIHEGIASLLVSIPSISRPEWTDGRVVRGWDELSRELDAQALAKAERAWKDE
jgi:hypothetical protein